MVKTTLLKLKIRKASGNFSTFVGQKGNTSDIEALLKYAAKKANAEQRKLVSSAK